VTYLVCSRFEVEKSGAQDRGSVRHLMPVCVRACSLCCMEHVCSAADPVPVLVLRPEEILRYSPDVVCLQEVDAFSDFLEPELAKHDYAGVWQKKTEKKQDGVAIFWKAQKFALEAREHCEYQLKNGVGLFVRLNHKGGSPICVANTHLFWNPAMEYIKLSQSEMYLNRAAAFAGGNPLVVCGDLNSMPDSDCFNLYTKQHVTHTFTPVQQDDEATGQVCSQDTEQPVTKTYSHPLALRPAYNPLPQFTTLTDDFRGTLDHIFLTPQLVSHAHLAMFPEAVILEVSARLHVQTPSPVMLLSCIRMTGCDGNGRRKAYPRRATRPTTWRAWLLLKSRLFSTTPLAPSRVCLSSGMQTWDGWLERACSPHGVSCLARAGQDTSFLLGGGGGCVPCSRLRCSCLSIHYCPSYWIMFFSSTIF